jgi:hypothetical protein
MLKSCSLVSLFLVLAGGCGGGPSEIPDSGDSQDSGARSDAGSDAQLDAGSDAGPAPACAPGADCPGTSACIALTDNSGRDRFALRMSHLVFSSPGPFSRGIVASVIAGGASPQLPQCNLAGDGSLSWILDFDRTGGMIRTGAAQSPIDPLSPYELFSGTIGAIAIAPVQTEATPDSAGEFVVSGFPNLQLPVLFAASTGMPLLVLPLRGLQISGTLSPDRSCIGTYNAAGLDPASSCAPDETHPAFIDGGQLTARMTLEEADTIVIDTLGETLCVLLTGDAARFGDGARPVSHCTRDASGRIVFQGDWCDATDSAATPSCADSMRLSATFAASAVVLQ